MNRCGSETAAAGGDDGGKKHSNQRWVYRQAELLVAD